MKEALLLFCIVGIFFCLTVLYQSAIPQTIEKHDYCDAWIYSRGGLLMLVSLISYLVFTGEGSQ